MITVQSGVTEVEFTSYTEAMSYAAKVSRNNGSAAIIDSEFVVVYVAGRYILTAFVRG